ncbi:MAG: DUF4331 family protein [Nonlabens sp.]
MKFTKYLSIAALAIFAISCNNDDDLPTDGGVDTDFSGTFAQEDQMGRPGINTVFTPTDADENSFNVTTPANQLSFQPTFQSRVEAYYNAYSQTAGTTLMYENNLLGIDLPTLTTVLAIDVLQVAPDAETSYFSSAGVPLTGRTLEDDVIDVSLILLFGGNDGMRFTSPTNLVSDNVGLESGAASDSFPYLTPATF